MTRSVVTPLEEMRRIPGLFRRWELSEILEAHRHYHLEEAGTHADGTPLVALYVNDAAERQTTRPHLPSRKDSGPRPVGTGLPPTHLLVTEVGLLSWLDNAERGDILEYHRGALAIDRLALGSRLPKEDARELDRVAKAAIAAVGAGRAHLMQRRHGAGDYSYLIVSRSRPALFARSRKAREFAS